MKYLIRPLILCIAIWLAMASSHSAFAGGKPKSGITGRAVLSFSCDLITPAGINCEGGYPVHALIYAFDEQLNSVGALFTDPDGYFTMALKPGTYHLLASYSATIVNGTLHPLWRTVTVEKKQFTQTVVFIEFVESP